MFQFIWQFQYFNKAHLQTIDGEQVEVISTGQFNYNQGPDFLNGRVRIGATILAGNIELHLTEADWTRHAHSNDPNYRNIILHVLWEHPGEARLSLPTISLKERVSKILLQRYDELMRNNTFVPCLNSLHQVSALTWLKWKERLLAERLIRKSALVLQYLHQCNQHWEEVLWWMLARNFGIPINPEPFEAVARSLPLTIIARHRNHIHQLEALLLGQAGLLDKDFQSNYARLLSTDYKFYSFKYQLNPIPQQVHFLRMRPQNFPTVRMAQLAMLLHNSTALFSQIKEAGTVKDLYALLHVTASEYWNTHYLIDEPTASRPKALGAQMIENIIINTIVPMLFAYGHFRNEQRCKDKALDWLEQLAPEKNTITNQWAASGVLNEHAWDSQALIELKKEYCDVRRCLECAVGSSLLRAKENLCPVT
ncbi:MAG TPA: DUF2851 family protein [Chitinophagaceae bacterium]|nr:DUF2851 family protein [Chitinophagaceae bacterium]